MKIKRADALAVLALIALWLLYFWRIFTPSDQDALSLTEGDFSGQFVAFMGYQVERLGEGEVPLWNPYNYAGHPFLADTQSAVFYPPRLLTVTLVNVFTDAQPGDLYAALESEMALHVLLGTLLTYALVRRLTARPGDTDTSPDIPSVLAGLVAALTIGYGGYVSGYPQLQLAVLEAGIWLPLILLGLFQATHTPHGGWRCVVLAGVALGLSLLAGHPQTSLFALYTALAFLGWRLWQHTGDDWRTWIRRFVLMAALFGLVAGGLAAVQLLPGLEYLQHTTRQAMDFDAKGNGFPFSDIAQVLFPGYLTLWSPLYAGIMGLGLAALAAWRRVPYSGFFAVAAGVALLWSFGAGTALYDVVYLLAPGASWFRGQERAAYIIAHSTSILAGLGTAHLLRGALDDQATQRFVLIIGSAILVICVAFALVYFVLAQGDGDYVRALQVATFAALLAGLGLVIIRALLNNPGAFGGRLALLALIVFDLFSITQGAFNYDPGPAQDRLPEPALVTQLREELLQPGARVDGTRGVRENYGTLYDVADIHGISPLELESVHALREDLPDWRTWELLGVHYVLTDWQELPVPSTIIETAEDPLGAYNVHELATPRGFAHLAWSVTTAGDDAGAYNLLAETWFDAANIVILENDPGLDLPGTAPEDANEATITRFEPEHITVQVETPTAAILTLALPHYPGWHAEVNGEKVDILRAYGGLSAIALPESGAYTVELRYQPWTFTIGAALTLTTLALILITTGLGFIRSRNSNQ